MSDPCVAFVSLLTPELDPVRVSVLDEFASEEPETYGASDMPQARVNIASIDAEPIVQADGETLCLSHTIQVSSFSFTRAESYALSDQCDLIIETSDINAELDTGPLYLYDAETRTHGVTRTYNYLAD